MKLPTLLLLAASALLLPSCISWDIGGHLRAKQTTYTGIDVNHPVDGKLYRHPGSTGTGDSAYYLRAPEVTYTYAEPAMLNSFGMQVVLPAASHVRPTGRILTARVDPADGHGLGLQAQATPLDALPRGLCAEPVAAEDTTAPCPACLGWQREEPSFARRALIAASDYVADPLLNVITPPVELICYTAAIPFVGLYVLVRDAVQQEQDGMPAQEP